MERRFVRKLETSVVVDPELIGGVRVVVGDEVLDTSIRARLEQMKAALDRLSGTSRVDAERHSLSFNQPARTADRSPTCN